MGTQQPRPGYWIEKESFRTWGQTFFCILVFVMRNSRDDW